MKRMICACLAVIILLGLFSGCGAAVGTQSPGTPNEFLRQFNRLMKAEKIPLTASFSEPEAYGAYDAINKVDLVIDYSGEEANVVSENLECYMIYEGDLDGNLLWIHIQGGKMDQSEEFAALFRKISLAASLLCDPSADSEKLEQMYDGAGKLNNYISYEDGIGSFYSMGDDHTGQYIDANRFYQPKDLTHIIDKEILYVDESTVELNYYYEIYFAVLDWEIFEQSYMTIAELEASINAYFKEQDIPLQGMFVMDSVCSSELSLDYVIDAMRRGVPMSGYGELGETNWELYLQFTDWDHPNVSYPKVEITDRTREYYPNIDERTLEELVISQYFPFFVTASAKSYSADAAIAKLNLGYEELSGENCFAPYAWDEAWHEIADGVFDRICDVWTEKTGDDAIGPFRNGERTYVCETNWWYETENFRFEEFVFNELELTNIGIDRSNLMEPENWLDPVVLDYPFTFNVPLVADAPYSEAEADSRPYRYCTSVYGMPVTLKGTLDIYDYLRAVGAGIKLGDGHYVLSWNKDLLGNDEKAQISYVYKRTIAFEPFRVDGEYYEEYTFPADRFFLLELFAYDDLEYFSQSSDEMIWVVYYNESVDYDQIYSVPIGVSQHWDDEMTAEEAIALHTTAQDVAYTGTNFTVSVYAPRDIAHIIMKFPETQQTAYFVLPKLYYEDVYETPEAFIESMLIVLYSAANDVS